MGKSIEAEAAEQRLREDEKLSGGTPHHSIRSKPAAVRQGDRLCNRPLDRLSRFHFSGRHNGY